MRAETLHRLTTAILLDIEECGIEVLLPRLITALEEQVANSDEDAQTKTAEARDEVISGLEKSDFDDPPALDRELLISIGAFDLLGARLAKQIDDAFAGNEITPASALEQLREINAELQALYKKVYEITESLSFFNVEEDELEPGEFEVTIVIPGGAIHDELGKFGRETIKLNQILGVFSEIATGSRAPIKMRAIASTDPTFLLDSPPAVAALFAMSVERLAAFYIQILTIIKMHREMKRIELPANVIDPLKKHIEKSVGEGIEQVAKLIQKEHFSKIETVRRAELRLELRTALRGLADRLDRGYGFDVRGEGPEVAETEEGQPPAKQDAATKAVTDALKIVEDARPRIKHFEAASEPILGLSPPDSDDDRSQHDSEQ